MATPTPGKPAPAQVAATPPVSTPFSASHNHLGFSPHGPRSVQPSPQHVKKSPANSNTLYGYPSVGGNHPTNSSFGAGYDSPSAAMALGAVSGLGELGMDGLGTPGASGLAVGLGSLTSAGGDDQDRSRRLAAVIDILKANKGRLSEAGMERLAQRVGLECIWEVHMGSGGGSRTLIIAGSALALDIDFTNNVVQKVSLAFPESPGIVTRHAEKAGAILLEDLLVKPTESPLTKKLDRFAANLERLAHLDKLSVIPSLNCYEAIAGIYESLESLHKWEMSGLKESGGFSGKTEEFVERAVMCTRSGKPLMHARDRLGLSLDYWEEKRRISRCPGGPRPLKTWSLLVECAPTIGLYGSLSLRVSKEWISADIQKVNPPAEEVFMAPEGEPVLDWLNPENTLLPSTNLPRPDAMEGVEQSSSPKFPEVMFVAKFDPPVVVPFNLADQIYTSTGATIDFQMGTFDALMFPPASGDKPEQGGPRILKQDVSVSVFSKNGEKSIQRHRNTLIVEKIDYGRTLVELPFTHPRQLVEMLPALRQYAFLSTLLAKTVGVTAKIAPKVEEQKRKQSKREGLAGLLAEALPLPRDQPFAVDISFTIQPHPRLVVVFPFKKRTANVTFEIKLNGEVQVLSQNIIDDEAMEEGEGKKLTVADLGRMLEITEDLGIWVEFIRGRLG